MSKSSVHPELFSKRFNIPESELSRLGVFDPTLNVDTLLFPDPLLLERSDHKEMRDARETFDRYFEKVMTLLHGIKEEGDKVWRTAFKQLSFPEIKGTCLGYGAASISGRGTGPKMTEQLVRTGQDVVRMGIDDPDLFMAMGLFEENFGPDLVGDMFTNIAFSHIADFNQRIIQKLGIPAQDFSIKLANGTKHSAKFALNMLQPDDDVPVILLPKDILRDLPIATCWAEVQNVASENEEFRDSLNTAVAHLWSKKTLESKSILKNWALSTPSAFGALLDMLHGHDGKPYDFAADPLGEIVWRKIGEEISRKYPFEIESPKKLNEKSAVDLVKDILDQFIFLIEKRDLWRELYADQHCLRPRIEKSCQRLFYAMALSYCKAYNLDVTPEADTGRGPVDFKFSSGIKTRILIEIKLSSNTQVVKGFEKQLDIYNEAENPIASYYVVVNVGHLGNKLKKLNILRDKQISMRGSAPELIVVDGLPRQSASKVK